jgi:hypothetical protein
LNAAQSKPTQGANLRRFSPPNKRRPIHGIYLENNKVLEQIGSTTPATCSPNFKD